MAKKKVAKKKEVTSRKVKRVMPSAKKAPVRIPVRMPTLAPVVTAPKIERQPTVVSSPVFQTVPAHESESNRNLLLLLAIVVAVVIVLIVVALLSGY